MGPTNATMLATIMVLLTVLTSQNVRALSMNQETIRQLPPGISPYCSAVLKCVCFLSIARKNKALIILKFGLKVVSKTCFKTFGKRKEILTFVKFCKPYRVNGKIRAKKVVKAVNNALNECGGA